MIFLKINCSNFTYNRLVWCHHTKFQTGMVAAIPLPAPLLDASLIHTVFVFVQ